MCPRRRGIRLRLAEVPFFSFVILPQWARLDGPAIHWAFSRLMQCNALAGLVFGDSFPMANTLRGWLKCWSEVGRLRCTIGVLGVHKLVLGVLRAEFKVSTGSKWLLLGPWRISNGNNVNRKLGDKLSKAINLTCKTNWHYTAVSFSSYCIELSVILLQKQIAAVS